jgi:hypothetical protein
MNEKLKIGDKVKVKDPAWPWENHTGICVSNQVIHVGQQVCMVKFGDTKLPALYSVEYLEKIQ